MVDETQLPNDAAIAGKVIDAKVKERGLLGMIFGTREHAPTNIAAITLILLFVALLVVLFADLPQDVSRNSLVTTFMSAITFVIGIIFGRRID